MSAERVSPTIRVFRRIFKILPGNLAGALRSEGGCGNEIWEQKYAFGNKIQAVERGIFVPMGTKFLGRIQAYSGTMSTKYTTSVPVKHHPFSVNFAPTGRSPGYSPPVLSKTSHTSPPISQ